MHQEPCAGALTHSPRWLGTAWGPLLQQPWAGLCHPAPVPPFLQVQMCAPRAQTCMPGGVGDTRMCRAVQSRQGAGGTSSATPLPGKASVLPPRVFLAVTCVTSAAVAAGGGRGRLSLLPHAAFALRLTGSRTGGRARCRCGPAAPTQVPVLGVSWSGGLGVRRELCGCAGSQAGAPRRGGLFLGGNGWR